MIFPEEELNRRISDENVRNDHEGFFYPLMSNAGIFWNRMSDHQIERIMERRTIVRLFLSIFLPM